MKILYFIALLFILVSVSYSQSDTASLNLSENNIFDKVASGENHKLDVASNLIDLYNFKTAFLIAQPLTTACPRDRCRSVWA